MVKTRNALTGKNWLKKYVSLRSRLSLCLLWAVVILGPSKTHAQKLIFENIGVRSGLPSTEVYNLFQDHKGYLWIFTEYGIVKYNGTNYVPVCKNLPLKESAVYGVTSSTNGNIYISNSTGNFYRIYDDKAYKITGISKSVIKHVAREGVICDVFMDNNNGFYFSSFFLTHYVPAGKYAAKGLKKESVSNRKRTGNIRYAVRINERPLEPGSSKTKFDVKIIDQNGKRSFNWFKRPINWSRVVARTFGGTDYIATQNRLECHNSKGETRVHEYESLIVNMEVDKNGHVWLSLIEGGLIEYDSHLNEVDRYFDKIIVSDILFDNQGGMWVSTIGRGVYHCKDINQKSYKNIPELKDGYIYLLQEENNSLFIGTYLGDLFQSSGNTTKKVNFGLSKHAITGILYLKGKYIITSSLGIVITDRNFKPIQRFFGAAYGVSRVSDDVALILSANSVMKYEVSKGLLTAKYKMFSARSASRRFGNEFFVVSRISGISRDKNFKSSTPAYLAPLKNKEITRTVSEDEHNIWFCSKGNGIYCLNTKNQLHHYVNLPSTMVNDICFSKANQVVIATNKGVFATLKDSIDSKSAWKLILNEESTRLLESGGKLYIGTKNGLTSMNSSSLIFTKKYRFHLNSIFTRGKQMRLKKNLVFNYNQNDLYLNYDLLNYHSDDHQLEYKLEGPTQLNDVVTGTRLHLQNLSPGEYVLYVNPLMNNTKSSDLQVVTRFEVRPAFWQTWTFRIVVLIIILATIFLAFWTINNRRNKKIREVNQIENLLTEYRLTALKSQVNPHFMSNSLVAIQRLILEEETDKANQYIAKFSLLLRSLLEYSNRSSATIRNELNMIELYVELEQLRFSDHFVFEIQIDAEINVDSTYMPALITQPFVENAIWHGLLPLNGTRQAKLILSVTEYNNGIVVSVKDNGVGRAFNKEKKKHGEFESRGTSLIIQRMENLNRLYNSKEGRINFIDLKDENGQPAGTEVQIVLPDEILIQLYDRRNS